jgi:Transcription elongation factor, GreA/GreB, C-term
VTYRSQTGPDDEVRSVRLVSGVGDPERGVVSEDSPVGSVLLGLSVGDDAEVALPEGTRTLVVLDIEKGSGLQEGLSRDNVIPLSNPRQPRAPALPAATPRLGPCTGAPADPRWAAASGRVARVPGGKRRGRAGPSHM